MWKPSERSVRHDYPPNIGATDRLTSIPPKAVHGELKFSYNLNNDGR